MLPARKNSPTRLPIVPRHQLYLMAHGQGNDARFARLFRETWQSIPLPDRRRMLTHWQDNEWSRSTQPAKPQIELLDGWTEPILTRNFRPKTSRAFGQCNFLGNELRFHAAVVDRLPEAHVRELVAHELAHVFWLAQGDCSRRPICEIRADRQMTRWGFDPFAMDDWIYRNFQSWTKQGKARWYDLPRRRDDVEHLLGDWTDGRFHPRYQTQRGTPVSAQTWNIALAPFNGSPDNYRPTNH